jgi:hypothetical protein
VAALGRGTHYVLGLFLAGQPPTAFDRSGGQAGQSRGEARGILITGRQPDEPFSGNRNRFPDQVGPRVRTVDASEHYFSVGLDPWDQRQEGGVQVIERRGMARIGGCNHGRDLRWDHPRAGDGRVQEHEPLPAPCRGPVLWGQNDVRENEIPAADLSWQRPQGIRDAGAHYEPPVVPLLDANHSII